jgi:DtxR family Mn-dependent transcriptional regulator
MKHPDARVPGVSSVSAENYIKTIFHLSQAVEDGVVKTKAIAEALHIAQPSVTSMLKTLCHAGQIDYQPYQGVRLTDQGRHTALRVIRKHRLIEVFLIETLNFPWDEVHDEAEQLEHALSDRVTDRLDAFLGFPSFDPHGDPIPSRDGRFPSRDAIPLSTLTPPATATITRVTDQTPDVLRYLASHGLTPNTQISLTDALPFDGPLVLHLAAAPPNPPILLSRALARRVLVLPDPAQPPPIDSAQPQE